MSGYFKRSQHLHSLSVQDLLDARDAYHVHLANMTNVTATAIGRYRIREEDPDVDFYEKPRSRKHSPPRRFDNTVIKPWSWPCVYVFVREWRTIEQLRDPDDVVPRFLYLPDGRIVPTCVLLAEPQPPSPPPPQHLTFPSEVIGGGYPVLSEVQGDIHVGSIGCLVSDGRLTYGLTNRHVVGEAGHPVLTIVSGDREQIGAADGKQVGKLPFSRIYPGWRGERVLANLDAGLIRVNDTEQWTAQLYGVGELDTPVDLNVDTISLELLECPLRAFGAAGGEMAGEILGLFYRYKSIGGVDYVADLLIGSRRGQDPLTTRPGDSGTLWVFDHEQSPEKARKEGNTGARARRWRPVALQWGGHVLAEAAGESQLGFALATFLSTICRELDVELIRDWNIGFSEYWGKLGHYKAAAGACGCVTDAKLATLMKRNLENISFDDPTLEEGGKRLPIDAKQFCPLADVPDLRWRWTRKADSPNHYADMDQNGKAQFADTTLMQLCEENDDNISPQVWNQFYDSLRVPRDKRGALPFRVWQIFDAMVEFAKDKKVAEYVCAAGILGHYVADASMPLHISWLHHGRPDRPEEEGVHSLYDTGLPDRFAPELVAGVNAKLDDFHVRDNIGSGHQAAAAVVDLMGRTLKATPPMEIIEAYNTHRGRMRKPQMWDQFRKRICSGMAESSVLLASLWQSAWKKGNGKRIAKSKLRRIDRSDLRRLYEDDDFLPARLLPDL